MLVFSSSSGEWNSTLKSLFLESNAHFCVLLCFVEQWMIGRGSNWSRREKMSSWMCASRNILCGFSLQISVVFITVNELSLPALFLRWFFSLLQIWKGRSWAIYANACRRNLEEPDVKPWKPQTFYSEVLHMFTRWSSCPHRKVVRSPVPSCSV